MGVPATGRSPPTLGDLMPQRPEDAAAAEECGIAAQLAVCCGCQRELLRKKSMRCTRCKLAFYCSKECQTSYHKRHVKWCKAEAAAQAKLRAAHPEALVCSSSLCLHVRRWDAEGTESCPDPRYYLRKTAATHPSYSAAVGREPAMLTPYWSRPRPPCPPPALAAAPESTSSLAALVLDALGGDGGLEGTADAGVAVAALCACWPARGVPVAGGAEELYSELQRRAGTPANEPQNAGSTVHRTTGKLRRLPPLPLPPRAAKLVGLVGLAAGLQKDDDIVLGLCAQLCAELKSLMAAAAVPPAPEPVAGDANESAWKSVQSPGWLGARQLLVAAQAEGRLAATAGTTAEAAPHHKQARVYAQACAELYVAHIGSDTPASRLVDFPGGGGGGGESGDGNDSGRSDGAPLAAAAVEGWWVGLFEWGRSSRGRYCQSTTTFHGERVPGW